MNPGAEVLVETAARALAPGARVLDVAGAGTRLPGRALVSIDPASALAAIASHQGAGFDTALVSWPSRVAPLMPLLTATRAALRDGGVAFVLDLVWQTAPTPELIRAFAPAAGREKIRPIEGYEMQIEYAGFEIAERAVVAREAWAPALAPEERAAVDADARGAARLVVWTIRAIDV